MEATLKIKNTPAEIFAEWEKGNAYKASLGERGIAEQSKINERFFTGDQWHGAQCGKKRPLVSRNVIKRIGEYKMSVIAAEPITVNFTADGIPYGTDTADIKEQMLKGEFKSSAVASAGEVSVITEALSNYYNVCAERLKFQLKSEELLRSAYISGSAIAYTYWDNDADTGLFADYLGTKKIKGDIAFQVLDAESVVFAEPTLEDLQSQPYILIAEKLDLEKAKRIAEDNNVAEALIEPDYSDSRTVTVITKLFKQWDKESGRYKIMALKVTKSAYIKKPFDIELTHYPLAIFSWQPRRHCIYGESEITYLIPNQIAINRMLTAECWAALTSGMPKMIINNDMIGDEIKITNDPGQIIRVNAGYENDLSNAMQYLNPAPFAAQYSKAVNELTSNTLSDAGANEVALGDIRPDNAAAIIQMREAALQPMQLFKNRYYAFIEEIARIWADFWLNKYSVRKLCIKEGSRREYIPFDAARYKNLNLTSRVDVGASTLYSEAVVISTLDNLLRVGVITPKQYLERLPKGIIPNVETLSYEVSNMPLSEIKKEVNRDDR